MPLKLRMRPGERVIVNGVVLRNQGGRAVELEVLNRGTILHERDIMLPDQATTPHNQIYFLLQAMHLDEGDREAAYRQALAVTSRLFLESTERGDHETMDLVADIVRLIGERDYIGGMRRLQKVIGRPGDARKGSDGDGADA